MNNVCRPIRLSFRPLDGVIRYLTFGLSGEILTQMFIDYVEIEVTAGSGGHGCVAFHTEKFIP